MCHHPHHRQGLDERKAELRIQFKDSPGGLFPDAYRNELVVRVQPDEAIYMKMNVKEPGFQTRATMSEMDLSYKTRCVVWGVTPRFRVPLTLQFHCNVAPSESFTHACGILFRDITHHNISRSYEGIKLPEAYERLILDVFRKSHSHFVRSDELREAWKIFTPMLHEIDASTTSPVKYEFGSRGPDEAGDMLRDLGYRRSEDYHWHSSKI